MRVAFLHPDLGIGGAEQLVINLALSCKRIGCYVKIFTPYYDQSRAFSQTKDGTLDVEVRGNLFPRRIFGRFHAFCEYLRMLFAAIYLILFGGHFDLVIVDQIPLPVPLLKLRFNTMFYCHFPDKLLCVERRSFFKRIYRFFIDLLEEITMLFAKIIVVNSNYTKKIFRENFKIISKLRNPPSIIYPCIDLSDYDRMSNIQKEDLLKVRGLEKLGEKFNLNKTKVLFSLNRYERKKNLGLALDAFLHFMENRQKIQNADLDSDYILIFAGGFDPSLTENIEVFDELNYKDFHYNKDRVFFLKNISNEERSIILKSANVVIYTPKNEHFGIVPVESMYCGAFVIAHKSGGPTESVKDNETGYLIENEDPQIWAEKIQEYFSKNNFDEMNSQNSIRIKTILKNHVLQNFSLRMMESQMVGILSRIIKVKRKIN